MCLSPASPKQKQAVYGCFQDTSKVPNRLPGDVISTFLVHLPLHAWLDSCHDDS